MPKRDPFWSGDKITHPMADSRRAAWEAVLWDFKPKVKRVLEVGSYEGQSALFWHRFFGAEVMCIDKWETFADGVQSAQEVEANFDLNVKGLPIDSVKGDSTAALNLLHAEKKVYDLVYIDGDHRRNQVMIDTCLAWRLLRRGGIMIWDDWHDYEPQVDDADRPESAIRCFLAMETGTRIIADTGQQLFVQKL